MTSGKELVRVRDLSKSFVEGTDPQGNPIFRRVLQDVSFDIMRGEFIMVVGGRELNV